MVVRFALILALALPAAFAADPQVVEEIVAKVNGDVVTRGDLRQKRAEVVEALRAQGLKGTSLDDAARKQETNILRDEIDELLLVQKAKDSDINVDSDVNRQLAAVQVESGITDTDKFHEFVRQQTGMSFEDSRDKLKRDRLVQRVVGQEVMSRISVPEADLQKYYEAHKGEFIRKEEVFLSQIVITTENKTPEQVASAEKKAKDAAARAKRGEKFSDLVREYSDDTATARNGGSVGGQQRGMMRAEIENAVFGKPKGYVTDPIKIPNGYLILRIDDRYEEGQASFEEVKSDVNNRLATPKVEPLLREYLTKLRRDAFLELKAGYVDSGAAPGKDTKWSEGAQLKAATTTKEAVAALRKRKLFRLIPINPFPGALEALKEKPGTVHAPEAAPASSSSSSEAPEPGASGVK
jgi:peptidyl-prolyl cis-trans isomerase SurA